MAAPEGFHDFADFLSPEEAAALLGEVQAMTFDHDVFRGQRLKRGYAQFGHAYVSAGRKLEAAAPMPARLRALVAKAQPYLPEGTEFHQCIVTRYPPKAGIGWHTDAPRFGEWIMGISLGGEAQLQFRPNGAEAVSHELRLSTGSMYLLSGRARWDYQHQVPPVKVERYSLTFRSVVGEVADSG